LNRKIIPSEIKSVLISRTDNIGDVILTLPLVYVARCVFKNAEVIFYVNEKLKPLLNRMGMNVNILTEDEQQNYRDRKRLFAKHKFDLAIFAKPRFDLALMLFQLGTKFRVGTAYRWYSFLYNLRVKEHRKFADKHESEYNLNLLREFTGIDENCRVPERLLNYDENERTDFLERAKTFGLSHGNKYIVIHPGSRGSARDISLEQFREIGIKLLAAYPDHKIVYTGLESEMEIVTNSMPNEANERMINLAGKLSLRELMILIDNSKLFISNSTGPIHIAGALNKNIIGFYPNSAPVNDVRWKPLGTNVTIFKPNDGSDNMLLIDTNEVVSSAGRHLKA
jgi:ADP-heptose:LPS heptosyltransferase